MTVRRCSPPLFRISGRRASCTLDPASLLMTSHFHLGLAEFTQEWMAAEYGEERNGIPDAIDSTTGLSTLHEGLGGDRCSPSPAVRAG